MEKYYYLVLTPESLIASHLAPFDFGNYLSVGTQKRIHGQNIFFEVNPEKMKDLPFEYLNKQLIPYPNGEPKRSVFASIYRALERTPLAALKNLYLSTDDGKVLELYSSDYEEIESDEIHLYQQFNPITTRVASKLLPNEFIGFLTDTNKPVSTPKIFFVELLLNELAIDPHASLDNLPYPNPDHLRECLVKLNETKSKLTKTVLRFMQGDLNYRTIKSGFFVGEKERYLYFPFPKVRELESKYYSWWRSALTRHF
ncbi:hypothetical protein [Maribellus maritimus]|uniref:hypothetical protein n=1 Tax=Maribellus maritimus TaxID=2870838 RepID=UPI001EEC2290|nr:hypothetical protein [Maribellus maritimus]MCG6189550.1 hypothetical protein [Maribellus maritimus]